MEEFTTNTLIQKTLDPKINTLASQCGTGPPLLLAGRIWPAAVFIVYTATEYPNIAKENNINDSYNLMFCDRNTIEIFPQRKSPYLTSVDYRTPVIVVCTHE